MNKIFSFALMALFFASCQNTTENEESDFSSETTTEITETPASADPITLNPVAGDDALSGVPAPAPASTPTPAAAPGAAPAAGSAGKVALNPEHGMPGHRCEIPVGAPLNGAAPAAAPAGNAAPSMMQQPAPAAPAMAQPAGSSTGRVNPPHGQPGHDCAVPVGAPLNG